jgi:hypothetical protein
MKRTSTPSNWLAAAITGLALAFATSSGLAAQDIQLMPTGIQMNGDPNDTDPGYWGTYWITTAANATCTWVFDPTMKSDPTIPGSIYCVCDWTGGATDINFGAVLPNGKGTWLGDPNIQVIDGTQYEFLKMDVYWTNVTGMTSWATIGLMTPGYGMVNVTNNIPIPSTPGWQHYSFAIDPTLANLSSIAGVMFYRWQNAGAPCHAEFWVDNVQLIARAVAVPPPTMTLEKPGLSGVEIIMDGTGDEWQRNAISTPSGGGPYLWTSQGSYPVSYSCTITNFPDIATHLGFEAHMYLVNGDTAGSGTDVSGSADWGAPDLLIFRIENHLTTVLTTNGTTITTNSTYDAMAQIQWKTNYPGANATNIPVVVYPPSALGTWTVTFTDSTHGALTGPGITATNFTLPADAVLNNFSPATSFLQFGMFKNDGPNDGHNNGAHGTYSHVQFIGATANSFDDSFTGATLTSKYAWRKTDANYVQYIPPGAAWIVDWTLPANGFSLETKAALGPGFWNSPTITGYDLGGFHHGLLLSSDLSGTNSGYFRLTKRVATQLQVLLPGETNAPNTTTGKIGTPSPQTTGITFDLTINACDANWNIASTSDTVAFTSDDGSAWLPSNTPLVNGTVTIVGNTYFGSSGTWTITATDVTTNAFSAGTSTPITIP